MAISFDPLRKADANSTSIGHVQSFCLDPLRDITHRTLSRGLQLRAEGSKTAACEQTGPTGVLGRERASVTQRQRDVW